MSEDNTVFVLQRAIKAHRLKVTKSTVKEFLISHPLYPSLKSVCDGLKKWNIDYYPLKLSKKEILDLEPPYIAHMGGARGQLAFVEKNKDSKVTFLLNEKQRIVKSETEFSENLSGGVIVIDPDKKSGETGYRGTATLIYVLASTTTGGLWPLAAISAVSIIFPVYSIYYQGVKLKKWCPFCRDFQEYLRNRFPVTGI